MGGPTQVASAGTGMSGILDAAAASRQRGENPSRAPSAHNPYSSASGPDQIVDPTWVDQIQKHFPQFAAGRTREQILALKTDPNYQDLSAQVARSYDADNANALLKAGVQPSVPFLNVMYRAGTTAGLNLIAAAKTNPDAMAGDIAPDLNSRGNNGAGARTVAEFVKDPYAPGPVDMNREMQGGSLLLQGSQYLREMNEALREGREHIRQIERDYTPVKPPEKPQIPDPDPMKAFSSPFAIFAQIAAMFAKTPAIAGLNAMASSIQAVKDHDWEQYTAKFKEWKEQTDLAFKNHKQHNEDLTLAFEMASKNVGLFDTMLRATSTLAKDDQMLQFAREKRYEEAWDFKQRRDKEARESEKQYASAAAYHQLNAAQEAVNDGIAKGLPPEEQEKRKQALQEAYQHVRELEAAQHGYGTGGRGTGKPTNAQYIDPDTNEERQGMVFWDGQNYRLADDGRIVHVTHTMGVKEAGPEGQLFADVLKGVQRDNPEMPIDKQRLLANERIRDSKHASTAPLGQYMADAVPEIMATTGMTRSEARLEAMHRYGEARTTITGNQRERIRERYDMYEESKTEIDHAMELLHRHIGLAGAAGRATRLAETASNLFGSNYTDRAEFRSTIQLLQAWGGRLLLHSDSRPLAAEKGQIGGIIRGLEAGDTTANTLKQLENLKGIYTRLQHIDEGALSGGQTKFTTEPQPTNTPYAPANRPWDADPVVNQ